MISHHLPRRGFAAYAGDRLGTSVIQLDYENVVRLAEDLATVDQLFTGPPRDRSDRRSSTVWRDPGRRDRASAIFCAFPRSTGQSPVAYVRKLRVYRAKALLVGSDCNLTDFALACGFAHAQQNLGRI